MNYSIFPSFRALLATLFGAGLAIGLIAGALVGKAYAEQGPTGDDLAESQSNYHGARMLRADTNVQFLGIDVGPYGDADSTRFAHFEGDTVYSEVYDQDSGTYVASIAEVYWFESSVWRSSDFYVVVLKVKASPNPSDEWYLNEVEPWWHDWVPGIESNDLAHFVTANMDGSGEHGAIRWDWSVPFETYQWEPDKVIQVASGYSAGIDGSAGFSEGGVLKDLTDKSTIQAKGNVNAFHKVSTKFTITLYKWQVLVSSASSRQSWQMRVLEGGHEQDSAYHEYFLVLQADKGSRVHLDSIDFGGNFRKNRDIWFDGHLGISASLKGLSFSPPAECYADDTPPAEACMQRGLCMGTVPVCDLDTGTWACNYPEGYEVEDESACDGVDEDCDGLTDEAWSQLGEGCDGEDPDRVKDGFFVCNPSGRGLLCDEDPCSSVECGEGCGTCEGDKFCLNGMCVDEGAEACGPISERGLCDAKTLMRCDNGILLEQKCKVGCGYLSSLKRYGCLEEKAEDAPLFGGDELEDDRSNDDSSDDDSSSEGSSDDGRQPHESVLHELLPVRCVPDCGDALCGPDGCGGLCGSCPTGDVCTLEGACITPAGVAADAPESDREPGTQVTIREGGCTASFGYAPVEPGALGMVMLLLGLGAIARRRRSSER